MSALVESAFFFLQQESTIQRRVEAVAGRFSGEGQDGSNSLVVILLVLGLGLVALVVHRAWHWRRFQRVFGSEGFGLDQETTRLLWNRIDAHARLDPRKILSTRERFAAILETLSKGGQHQMLRKLHTCWIAGDVEAREPRRGHEGFVQLEHIRLRRDDGFVIDGFLRRVGSDAVDFVVSEPAGQLPLVDEDLVIERARGEHVSGRALDVRNLHGPWTFGVGPQARLGLRRSEFRVTLALEGLLFLASPELATIRAEVLDPEISDHPLLAKHQKANPTTAGRLLAQRGQLRLAETFRFDDLSALGARIRLQDPGFELDVNLPVYVYLPFEIEGREEEYFISAQIVEIWTETLDGETVDQVMRCRFFEIEEEEIKRLRHLVNRLAGTGRGARSRVREILRKDLARS